ncbi:aminoglycoside phosphotransferase family protein [Pseudoroseicyclus tamaricis]|uniref:Phosphotransferase n=1 Tax=Pseudoroseicyclus tamaricis TaxID=2705421 RepID=A0A6B2K4M6_9RHOB|nr:phosphotransferase [Pseudoroseicyclus tamaricis]NDV02802.1 phosphotransferase [Pseudoroseicyclus tamaricis]
MTPSELSPPNEAAVGPPLPAAEPGSAEAVEAWRQETPFADWAATPLPGDASTRRYWRLSRRGETALLMVAPPGLLPPFLSMAAHLRLLGLAAPEVHEVEEEAGLAIIEDLGPETLAARLSRKPRVEGKATALVADLLAFLARTAPPPLPALGPAEGAAQLEPLFRHYGAAPPEAAEALREGLSHRLTEIGCVPDRLSLRDFHAENLIWRGEESGLRKLGLIDFQDAVLAPRAYDLASWLTDARRDAAPGLAEEVTARFARALEVPERQVAAEAAALGLMRSLRILGIFARLAQEGRRRYLGYVPRVYDHIELALTHPAVAPLAPLVRAAAPPPEELLGRGAR